MDITLDRLKSMLAQPEAPTLVDVRSPGEFAAGHIPGAINIPLEEVEARLPDLPKNRVVLVCHSGRRAGSACTALTPHHPELMVLEGGTAAWMEQGNPVVASTRTRWSIERQIRLIVGVLVGLGVALSLLVHPAWLILPGFLSVGLTFAAITNFCGMGLMLAKAPWNQPSVSQTGGPVCDR